jgi:hypothetical protein
MRSQVARNRDLDAVVYEGDIARGLVRFSDIGDGFDPLLVDYVYSHTLQRSPNALNFRSGPSMIALLARENAHEIYDAYSILIEGACGSIDIEQWLAHGESESKEKNRIVQ